jgi:hypothetical protein
MRFIFFICSFILAGIACATNQNFIIVLRPNTPLAQLEQLVQSILSLILDPLQLFIAGAFTGFTSPLTPLQALLFTLNPNVSTFHHIWGPRFYSTSNPAFHLNLTQRLA